MPLKRVPKSHDMSAHIARAAELQELERLIAQVRVLMSQQTGTFFSKDRMVKDVGELVIAFVANEDKVRRANVDAASAADAAEDPDTSASPRRR